VSTETVTVGKVLQSNTLVVSGLPPLGGCRSGQLSPQLPRAHGVGSASSEVTLEIVVVLPVAVQPIVVRVVVEEHIVVETAVPKVV